MEYFSFTTFENVVSIKSYDFLNLVGRKQFILPLSSQSGEDRITKVMAAHERPAASSLDESCHVLRDRDTPELSTGDMSSINPHHWPAFEPSPYVTAERSETAGARNFRGLLSVLRNDESK
jgi:hypothetical protein